MKFSEALFMTFCMLLLFFIGIQTGYSVGVKHTQAAIKVCP